MYITNQKLANGMQERCITEINSCLRFLYYTIKSHVKALGLYNFLRNLNGGWGECLFRGRYIHKVEKLSPNDKIKWDFTWDFAVCSD